MEVITKSNIKMIWQYYSKVKSKLNMYDQDTEDCLQQTFVDVIEHLEKTTKDVTITSPVNYLLRSFKNKFLQIKKENQKRFPLQEIAIEPIHANFLFREKKPLKIQEIVIKAIKSAKDEPAKNVAGKLERTGLIINRMIRFEKETETEYLKFIFQKKRPPLKTEREFFQSILFRGIFRQLLPYYFPPIDKNGYEELISNESFLEYHLVLIKYQPFYWALASAREEIFLIKEKKIIELETFIPLLTKMDSLEQKFFERK